MLPSCISYFAYFLGFARESNMGGRTSMPIVYIAIPFCFLRDSSHCCVDSIQLFEIQSA